MNQRELSYRGEDLLNKIAQFNIFICGAGALGSNLVNILSRQGFKNISVIDMDRVEAHNIHNQIYSTKDIGYMKVSQLKAAVYNNTKEVISIFGKELNETNAFRFFQNQKLVVDVFDNWKSRSIVKKICEENNIPCVHSGLSDSGYSEIKWNETYNIPKIQEQQDDVCDYPLASNLVHITVAILSEIIIQYISDGIKINREITLKDISVHRV